MKANEWKWALAILVIILLAYILPYTILTEVANWYGSLLIWIVLTLIVIIMNYFISRNWGK
ncbi:hypothetical protein CV093_13585 [Oceanobacillus sp. 143]|uniref:Uncharacterized protein n=1 Tax=Oceanobacillus zhaokaii TaxID=2052660 RepID=A0A345PIC0_9BACI|nr:hypothetical protein [Oceanobacillus zhaokaii]AXI09750.1 hypothetical protein CUC15_12795 [Oceanobacillus zhaokaii]QGS69052.1 hypothetical protein CV093_13585 [Oceanobacillus sp. 143]